MSKEEWRREGESPDLTHNPENVTCRTVQCTVGAKHYIVLNVLSGSFPKF